MRIEEEQRDNRNVVTALYVLDPDRVTPLVSETGQVFYELRRESVMRESRQAVLRDFWPKSWDDVQALLKPEQLEALVAPIALYPDPVLSQVLIASTNPQEVLDAGNWILENQGLKGKALDDAAAALDAWVRELMQWRFSPDTGCPFWLQKKRELKFDPLKEVRTFDDLKRFEPFKDEWLRGGPVRRYAGVRGYSSRYVQHGYREPRGCD